MKKFNTGSPETRQSGGKGIRGAGKKKESVEPFLNQKEVVTTEGNAGKGRR